jgi:hypothetical protein
MGRDAAPSSVAMLLNGHNLAIAQTSGQLVATCECGKWRRTLPVARNTSLQTLVAELGGRHERHLDRMQRRGAVEASEDDLPTLPDGDG